MSQVDVQFTKGGNELYCFALPDTQQVQCSYTNCKREADWRCEIKGRPSFMFCDGHKKHVEGLGCYTISKVPRIVQGYSN
jgi:hypothetical protein